MHVFILVTLCHVTLSHVKEVKHTSLASSVFQHMVCAKWEGEEKFDKVDEKLMG